MRKILLGIMLCLTLCHGASAAHIFLMKDVVNNKTLLSEGDMNALLSPCSTFKIPLALMGYESKIFISVQDPEWKYVPEKHEKAAVTEKHKQDMTPKKWMTYSAVWYSQEMTTKLGMEQFKAYVDRLNYGNKDVTGDPQKNNGLTHCWLGSSLKITPAQQAEFLTQLLEQKLPFSLDAQKNTRELIALEEDMNGWKLFGKTGSGFERNADGSKNEALSHGWFVGWLEKGDQRIVFVYHKSNIDMKSQGYGGPVAKKEALEKMREFLTHNKL